MYTDHITRAQLVEGHTGLSDFRVRMEQFYQDNRTYDGAGLDNCGAANPANSTNFTYNCRSAGQTYTATANGTSGRVDRLHLHDQRAERPADDRHQGRLGARRDARQLLRHEERLLLMRRAAQSGISLIEIMVAVAIIGVMFALGMPAYSTWIQNTQIRTAAEAVMNGLQTAKNEAIQRNVTVQLQLPNAANTHLAREPLQRPGPDPPHPRAAPPTKARPTRRSRSRRPTPTP